MIDPNKIKMGKAGIVSQLCWRQYLRSKLAMALPDTSEDFFNNVQQDFLDLLALELHPEGGVAQYLLQ